MPPENYGKPAPAAGEGWVVEMRWPGVNEPVRSEVLSRQDANLKAQFLIAEYAAVHGERPSVTVIPAENTALNPTR